MFRTLANFFFVTLFCFLKKQKFFICCLFFSCLQGGVVSILTPVVSVIEFRVQCDSNLSVVPDDSDGVGWLWSYHRSTVSTWAREKRKPAANNRGWSSDTGFTSCTCNRLQRSHHMSSASRWMSYKHRRRQWNRRTHLERKGG